MNNLPQILIDPIINEKDILETTNEQPEDCKSLTVPFSNFFINSDDNNNNNNVNSNGSCHNNTNNDPKHEPLNYNDHLNNIIDHSNNLGQTIVGKIFIGPLNSSHSSEKYRQLVWVQIYQKSSSISSRLNTQNLDIPTFVLLLKTRINPKNSEYTPDYYSPPYMKFNLKHTRSSPIDEKHFHIYTRCGEGITLEGEIADEHSVDYWLSIFNQNTINPIHMELFRTNEIKIRSAPNSPRYVRRRNNIATDVNKNSFINDNSINRSTHSISRTCIFETLSETQELESGV
ncbi:unnamed protein product [Schistosoma rodhaini]|uniref:Velvet domain-containing protein n=1 Tax=Schistosoma rodhaini TaxID=6188 RepID=A0A183QGS1_9TREM|nr:unnamed protein product [Schistosoma rodhaini]